MQIGSPSDRDRVFTLALVDGTKDEVEVTRPLSDGRFLAPVTPETPLAAALADEALASRWAESDVRFTTFTAPRLEGALAQQDWTSTTSCSSYSCSGSGCTPLGCAKPANTTQCFTNDGNHTACTAGTSGCVCCANSTSLPATSVDSRTVYWDSFVVYTNWGACQSAAPSFCQSRLGGSAKDWTFGSGLGSYCLWRGSEFNPECFTGTSTNSWVASCPKNVGSSCASSEYDAVPRNGSCDNPGSCTYSTGTVGCTTFH